MNSAGAYILDGWPPRRWGLLCTVSEKLGIGASVSNSNLICSSIGYVPLRWAGVTTSMMFWKPKHDSPQASCHLRITNPSGCPSVSRISGSARLECARYECSVGMMINWLTSLSQKVSQFLADWVVIWCLVTDCPTDDAALASSFPNHEHSHFRFEA